MSLCSPYSFQTNKAILFNDQIFIYALCTKRMSTYSNLTFIYQSKAERTNKVFVILSTVRFQKNIFDFIRFRLDLVLIICNNLNVLFAFIISLKNILNVVLFFRIIMSLHNFFFFNQFLNCLQLQISFNYFLWTIFIFLGWLLLVWIILISDHILVIGNRVSLRWIEADFRSLWRRLRSPMNPLVFPIFLFLVPPA